MTIRSLFWRFWFLAVVATGWALASYPSPTALAQTAPFYQGKTIRIIVGFTAGGLYDQYARILSARKSKAKCAK
jgi:tripartite-type tricarboxylate transporter receptor subunit TctC